LQQGDAEKQQPSCGQDDSESTAVVGCDADVDSREQPRAYHGPATGWARFWVPPTPCLPDLLFVSEQDRTDDGEP
jgi:hypothetical protein